MNNQITLPCSIGDKIYIIEDFNELFDRCLYYETKDGNKVVIRENIVDAFIIDEEGIHEAELTHDGYVKFSIYHYYTVRNNITHSHEYKAFFNEKDALDFIETIRK